MSRPGLGRASGEGVRLVVDDRRRTILLALTERLVAVVASQAFDDEEAASGTDEERPMLLAPAELEGETVAPAPKGDDARAFEAAPQPHDRRVRWESRRRPFDLAHDRRRSAEHEDERRPPRSADREEDGVFRGALDLLDDRAREPGFGRRGQSRKIL
jgi:hypothetical protein